MTIPLLDLEPQHAPLRDEILRAVSRVIERNAFILGEEVRSLEERVAAGCGSRFAVGVSSGTDALLVALMALDIRAGDEVIVPDFSFFATAGVVSRLGARPVFVDIDPVTFNLDPAAVARAVTPRTRAVIPVHLYGQCADMDPLLETARRRGLKVVEDAAQSIGAGYRGGRCAGTLGDAGCLSFFPTKNLGAMGDAGMVLTNDPALAERLRILRVHGAQPKYHHRAIGGNFRLDTLQAAVLGVKLDHLDRWTESRCENARRYEAMFMESGLLRDGTVSPPRSVWTDTGARPPHIYNQFVIRARDRDRLAVHLRDRGIGTEVYYPVPFHRQECFRDLGHRPEEFPESERAARETLALPVYPGLTPDQQRTVVDAIREFYPSA
jgi:dTDP-4-amino-4,6-dideoxygalactose transaminase